MFFRRPPPRPNYATLPLPVPTPGATLDHYVHALVGVHTPYDPTTNDADADAAAKDALGPRVDELTRDWELAASALNGVPAAWLAMAAIVLASVIETIGCGLVFKELGLPSPAYWVFGLMLAVGLTALALLVSRAATTTKRKGFWALLLSLGVVVGAIGILRAGELRGEDDEPLAVTVSRLILVITCTVGPALVIEAAGRVRVQHGAAFDRAQALKTQLEAVRARRDSGQRYIRTRTAEDRRYAEDVALIRHRALAQYPTHFPPTPPDMEGPAYA